MMKTTLFAVASILSAANAFAPSTTTTSSNRVASLSSSRADLETFAEQLNPNVKFFDPLALSKQDFWSLGNEATIGWLRQSEIKHGRIAMAAFVGYVVQSNFPLPWA
mgnify:CR=1 FL=1